MKINYTTKAHSPVIENTPLEVGDTVLFTQAPTDSTWNSAADGKQHWVGGKTTIQPGFHAEILHKVYSSGAHASCYNIGGFGFGHNQLVRLKVQKITK